MIGVLIGVIAAAALMWAPGAAAHSLEPGPAGGVVIPTSGPASSAAADGGLLILAALALSVLVGALCLSRPLRKAAPALATAGLFLFLLAGSAPHLVHHAFEPGKGAGCQILQLAGHADGTLGNPEGPPVVIVAVRLGPDPRLPAGTASAPSTRTRAPPA